MNYVLGIVLIFLLCVGALEFSGLEPQVRHGVVGGLGVFVAVAIAGLVSMTTLDMKRWRHTYRPVRYDTDLVPRIRTMMKGSVSPTTMQGYQQRVRVCLWVREAVAEHLELAWKGSPYDFSRMLIDPASSEFLRKRPALKRFLTDLLDLGVLRKGSCLVYDRRTFHRFIRKVFKEVGVP